MKKYLLLLFFILLSLLAGVLVLRIFSGDEDTWLCVNGQWLAHGRPSAPVPTTPCNKEVKCTAFGPENCPKGCVVCPPCLECSSISCQEKEFCRQLGFDESWYNNIKKRITNFQECVAAGNAVRESYPRQCQSDGETFIEDVDNELEKTDLIRVDQPRPNQEVVSPLVVKGQARGSWFFEGSFPIKFTTLDGQVLASSIAQAQSDWMTTDWVLFTAQLEFKVPQNTKGQLILMKDNPSGLPENEDDLSIPVVLAPATRKIELYYYNPIIDRDEAGNIKCSREGLVAVEREIPITKTPIQDAVALLLAGELTADERAQGIGTEYPLAGLVLKGASLKDGNLTLEFADPDHKTVDGSCRVGILWSQIEATAKQFSEVKEVRFWPEDLFQP